ncbi:IQ domain-containing protein E-like [Xenia sp. Carnegie-2017]|uniref:IQ domain-containing protein E-like n=1 Tax=Xenia sp. Carnegie-2017 TaxID=2897299 RepID=UPI001F03DC7B|nr:IQ domain-containing protein E-like [Xenia sp. Carnegie-2017]XP_046856980.1 IQ domain-containing protein E-like [Xenia sp. Carnegie-2017]
MMDNDEEESEVSSIISLRSLDDISEVKPTRLKKSKIRGHSPYVTQSYNNTTKAYRKTGHEAWSLAIRNGFTGLSSENSPANRVVPQRVQRKTKSHATTSNGPFSRDEHVLASGKPAYKSQEDYYDEILELRQVIKDLKSENGIMKTKLQRVLQENLQKDREIKDYLNPSKQSEEMRRTLSDKNVESSSVISSLKQKLHLMQRNLKDKENELRKLKNDLKTTNVDELHIQMETYYEETRRLQQLLSSVYSQGPGTRNIPDTRSSSKRNTSSKKNTSHIGGIRRNEKTQQDTSSSRDIRMDDEAQLDILKDRNQILENENRSLKKDLLVAIHGQINKENVDYADMNRVQMLKKINELEKLVENTTKNDREKDHPGNDVEIELKKQRDIIMNLKKDRTQYHKEVDELRVQLEVAEKEISQLKKTLKNKNERYEKNLLELTKEIQRNSSVRKENKFVSTSSPPRQTLKNTTGSFTKKVGSHKDVEKDQKQKFKTSSRR